MITGKIKKGLVIASLVLIGTTSLHADPKGAYVGLGYGMSTFTDGGYSDDVSDDLAGTGVSVSEDYGSSGFKLYGGYQFNRIIAIEASYTNYGESSLNATTGRSAVITPKAFGLAANIGSNFGEEEEYRFFGLVGLSSINLDESGEVDAYQDETGTSFKIGAGFEYAPVTLDGLGFRVAYEVDFFVVDATPEDYTQSLGLFYIGAQYKF